MPRRQQVEGWRDGEGGMEGGRDGGEGEREREREREREIWRMRGRGDSNFRLFPRGT